MTPKVQFIAPLLIAIALGAHAQVAAVEAIRTGHWTSAETKQYRDCVTRLTATQKPTDPGRPEQYCEVWEEGQHWWHLHPKIVKNRKRDSARFTQCNHAHEAEMNGTPRQFWTAMDLCLREAYGLKNPN